MAKFKKNFGLNSSEPIQPKTTESEKIKKETIATTKDEPVEQSQERDVNKITSFFKQDNNYRNIKQENIPVELIQFNKDNIYRKSDTEEHIEQLAKNIKNEGLLHAIVLHKDNDTDEYTLISGERRLRAIKVLGWKSVPARVFYDITLTDAKRKLYYANELDRSSQNILSPADRLEIYRNFVETLNQSVDEKRVTKEQIANELNTSARTITRYELILEFLTGEEINNFKDNELSFNQAVKIARQRKEKIESAETKASSVENPQENNNEISKAGSDSSQETSPQINKKEVPEKVETSNTADQDKVTLNKEQSKTIKENTEAKKETHKDTENTNEQPANEIDDTPVREAPMPSPQPSDKDYKINDSLLYQATTLNGQAIFGHYLFVDNKHYIVSKAAISNTKSNNIVEISVLAVEVQENSIKQR